MPTGARPSGVSDLNTLDKAFGGTGLISSAAYTAKWRSVFNNVLSGYVPPTGSSMPTGQGVYGDVWSRTSTPGALSSLDMYFTATVIDPGANNSDRADGLSVRCLHL